MKKTTRALLTEAIDYAGLFPPAALTMSQAVDEFLDIKSGPESWMTDRFVVSAKNFELLENELEVHVDEFEGDLEVGVALVAPTFTTGGAAQEQVRRILQCTEGDRAVVESVEIRMPTGRELGGCLKALKTRTLLDQDLTTYLEFEWSDSMGEAIAEAASSLDSVGFKARTGGVTADLFPSAEQLAHFIVTMASMDVPFKATAGLHQPLRHFDEGLGVHRHGFLNVLLASALAVTHDLNEAEVQAVLEVEDSTEIEFGDDKVTVLGFGLTLSEIEDSYEFFTGFGSCSLQEPIDGLKSLGYW